MKHTILVAVKSFFFKQNKTFKYLNKSFTKSFRKIFAETYISNNYYPEEQEDIDRSETARAQRFSYLCEFNRK
jgi:hypothetical protein